MPILDLGADFVPGATATADSVNDKFNGIEAFVNVTKLDEDNIQPQSITSALLDPSLQVALPSSIVTSLPGSPTNGQVIFYQNAAMATIGLIWQLRYNSAISGSSKWQFIGGGAYTATSDTYVIYNPVGSFGILSEGPNITTPLTGVYTVELSATVVHNGGGPVWVGFSVAGSVSNNGATVMTGDVLNGNGAGTENSCTKRRKSLTAGNVIGVGHMSASAPTIMGSANRCLTLTPERVG